MKFYMSQNIFLSLSEGGVTLLPGVFADLIVVIQLFCVSGSVQSIDGFDLTVTAIFSEDCSEPYSFL